MANQAAFRIKICKGLFASLWHDKATMKVYISWALTTYHLGQSVALHIDMEELGFVSQQ